MMAVVSKSGLLILALLLSSASSAAIDNSIEATLIANTASRLRGNGKYRFTSVTTGKTLAFIRTKNGAHFIPDEEGDDLDVQFIGNQARISGVNNKCVSAQWTTKCPDEAGSGCNLAAVTYACAVGHGELTGSTTLERTKQWWFILPEYYDPNTTGPKSILAKLQTQWGNKFVSKDTTTLYTNSNVNTAFTEKYYAKLQKAKPSTKPAKSSPSKTKAKTVCTKAGVWLHRHSGYIKTNPQCKSVLTAYRNKLKKGKRSADKRDVLARRIASMSQFDKSLHRRLAHSMDKRQLIDAKFEEQIENAIHAKVGGSLDSDTAEEVINELKLELAEANIDYSKDLTESLYDRLTTSASETEGFAADDIDDDEQSGSTNAEEIAENVVEQLAEDGFEVEANFSVEDYTESREIDAFDDVTIEEEEKDEENAEDSFNAEYTASYDDDNSTVSYDQDTNADVSFDFEKRGLEKRGPRLAYYLIAIDHILDMRTRAVSASQVRSFGGYQSSALRYWNKNDRDQLWYVDLQ